ncbi:MAG: hypothetical protein AABX37_02520 [Nanoarchaeota archaeon]
MRWKSSLEQGYVKQIPPDTIRAKSLLHSSGQAISSALKIKVETDTLKTIIRELYEGLRQCCEAIGYQKGYKFSSHEAITYFLEEVLREESIASRFDRYRKIRNGINYYGDDISPETVWEAKNEVPTLIERLKKHLINENKK